MKLIAVLLLSFALQPSQAHYGHNGDVLLPDPKVTPGDILPVTRDDICKARYAGKVRAVDESLKNTVYAEYKVKPHKGICAVDGCEVDHLISLELGGSNEIKNLWIQPYGQHPGALEKDKLENLLHLDVCKGYIPLATAQKRIASDWYQTYLLSGLDKKSSQTVSGTSFTTSIAPLLPLSGEPPKKQSALR